MDAYWFLVAFLLILFSGLDGLEPSTALNHWLDGLEPLNEAVEGVLWRQRR
jgi:hypothetical protein